ncbi:MAG TPA: VOC family protein [Hyphomicrobium sp.]|nr:VOC family protein [Hyphomicrobium sp.]
MSVTFVPCLWYCDHVEDAARFYTSVVPNSAITRVSALPVDSPSGPAGTVKIVEFTLAGAPMMGFAGGPHHDFNDAISLMLICDTQEEIDRLWDGLLQDGGKPVQCGWLKDRFGISWQITPRCLGEMIAKGGPGAAAATLAMMQMVKLDIAKLEAAYNG